MYLIRRLLGLVFLILVSLVLVGISGIMGCSKGASMSIDDDDDDDDDDDENGCDDETHCDNADPNYDEVFPEDRVNRIEISMTQADYQAMQDDLDALMDEASDGCSHEMFETACSTADDKPGVCIPLFMGVQCVPLGECESSDEGQSCESDWGLGPMVGNCRMTADAIPYCDITTTILNPCSQMNEGDLCFGGDGVCQDMGDGDLVCIMDNTPITDPCSDANDGDSCEIPGGVGHCVDYEDHLHCQVDGYSPPSNMYYLESEESAAGFWSRKPAYFPCTVKYNDLTWEHVGVRYKGNNSLASSEGKKKPLKLDFDEFEADFPETKDQRFYGFKHLSMHNAVTDTSYLHQKTSAYIMGKAGVPFPAVAFYEVYLDIGEGAEYLGLYVTSEMPAGPFLNRVFDENDGDLFKPDGRGAHFVEYLESSYHCKNNESPDFRHFSRLVDALFGDQNDRDRWQSDIEDVFDMEGFIQFYAVNQAIGNWDTYGALAHNFYLYHSGASDTLRFIPWDFDLAFEPWGPGLALAKFGGDWPLLQAIARDAHYSHIYNSTLLQIEETVFDVSKITKKINQWKALIKTSVENEPEQTVNLDDSVSYLINNVEMQDDAISQYLREFGYLDKKPDAESNLSASINRTKNVSNVCATVFKNMLKIPHKSRHAYFRRWAHRCTTTPQ